MISFFKEIFENYIFSGHTRSAVVKKNIVGGVAIKSISIVISLLYVPLLINYLDSERYGIWIALTSMLTWFHFFDIGLGNGLRNLLTEAITQNNYKKARELVSTSYALMRIIFG